MKINMLFSSFIISLFFAFTFAFYEESKFVTELDMDNFEDQVINSNDIWFIQFFATHDNDCLEYIDVYEKVGKALNGFIKVGAVDVDKARLLAYRYNIIKLPTIIYVSRDKNFVEHKGKKSEIDLITIAEKVISKQINENLEDKLIDLPFVNKVTKDEIEKQVKRSGRWIIAYYNQDFAPDDNFKTFFITLATKLQDNIKFGYCDISPLNEITEIKNVPNIVYYFGKKNNRSEVEYNKTLENIDDVVLWALNRIKTPDILELRNENLLRDACVNKKYCIISLISNSGVCDRNCKSNIKDTLVNLAERYKHYSVAWAIVRKNTMSTLEEIFSITRSSKLPILLAVNVKTLKSKELEDFNEAQAQQFLDDIFHGSGVSENRLPGFDTLLQEHYTPWHDEL